MNGRAYLSVLRTHPEWNDFVSLSSSYFLTNRPNSASLGAGSRLSLHFRFVVTYRIFSSFSLPYYSTTPTLPPSAPSIPLIFDDTIVYRLPCPSPLCTTCPTHHSFIVSCLAQTYCVTYYTFGCSASPILFYLN